MLFLLLSQGLFAQQKYTPTAENLANRAWFEASRFGVFIHWGVYSVMGDGEWVMNDQKMGLSEYALLPKFFNPVDFNAQNWAKLFKASGAKYITFTTRHHDSFSMWDSKMSDYNVVKATPFKRDIVKELVEACRAEGIKVMFYYSLLDWKRDEYLPAGRTGTELPGRDPAKGDWAKYIAFMKGQLTELLTQYGRIDGIWFDGHWDKKDANWHYDELYSHIHNLQPQCLIGNNHHIAPIEGEDFQMFERDLPGQNVTGYGTDASHVGELPKEVCGTIAGSWGFNIKDRQQKSFQEVLSYLVKAAGYGSNLLLNVGPMPNGEIQDYQQERLLQLGEWLKLYGESIYGTQGGFITPTDDYALTKKGNIIYLHVLNPAKRNLTIPGFTFKLQSLKTFDGQQQLVYKQVGQDQLLVEIPQGLANEQGLVLKLTVKN